MGHPSSAPVWISLQRAVGKSALIGPHRALEMVAEFGDRICEERLKYLRTVFHRDIKEDEIRLQKLYLF